MLLPFTAKAAELERFTPEQLESPQTCLCGKAVKLIDCLVSWTHQEGKDDWGYFAICSPMCLLIRISQGSC